MKDQELTAAIEQVVREDLEAVVRTTWMVQRIRWTIQEASVGGFDNLAQLVWCQMITQELQNMLKSNGITIEEHNEMARSILREKNMLATLREE
jgi:hypothetical protein